MSRLSDDVHIPDILVKEHGLKPDEKIVVFWTKEVSMPRHHGYRLPFRKVYSGPLCEFGEYMEGVRRRGEKKQGAVEKANKSLCAVLLNSAGIKDHHRDTD